MEVAFAFVAGRVAQVAPHLVIVTEGGREFVSDDVPIPPPQVGSEYLLTTDLSHVRMIERSSRDLRPGDRATAC